jgi:hypothetical protein
LTGEDSVLHGHHDAWRGPARDHRCSQMFTVVDFSLAQGGFFPTYLHSDHAFSRFLGLPGRAGRAFVFSLAAVSGLVCQSQAVACLSGTSRMWFFAERRFLSGLECLQIQGCCESLGAGVEKHIVREANQLLRPTSASPRGPLRCGRGLTLGLNP